MGSWLGRWLEYARGELAPQDRRSVETELLSAAPRPKEFVALLLSLRRQAVLGEDEVPVPASVRKRAARLFAALAGRHEVTRLVPIELEASAGVRGAAPAAIRAYSGGHFTLELTLIAGNKPGQLGLVGQLMRDGSIESVAGETIYLLSEDDDVVA